MNGLGQLYYAKDAMQMVMCIRYLLSVWQMKHAIIPLLLQLEEKAWITKSTLC